MFVKCTETLGWKKLYKAKYFYYYGTAEESLILHTGEQNSLVGTTRDST